MAKFVIETKTKVIERRVIVCSECGAKSKYYGDAQIKKFDGKDWLCEKCHPEPYKKHRGLRCKTCGHFKTKHDCQWKKGRGGVYKKCREIVRGGEHYWYKCPCEKYVPNESVAT